MRAGTLPLAMLPRGTLLNAFTVLLGGLIGWGAGAALNERYQQIALGGLGLVTLVIGLKMALGTKNVLVVAAAIALGGMLGLAIGIQEAFGGLAERIQAGLGLQGESQFVEIVVGASVLYCVGPMTLLGCIQDRLENKIELLALKSTMDGIVAIFFGAQSGPAMIVTAVIVLVVQSAITFSARLLKPLAEDEALLTELSATGGLMLMSTGFGLLDLLKLPTANYLPALLLAPAFVRLGEKWVARSKK